MGNKKSKINNQTSVEPPQENTTIPIHINEPLANPTTFPTYNVPNVSSKNNFEQKPTIANAGLAPGKNEPSSNTNAKKNTSKPQRTSKVHKLSKKQALKKIAIIKKFALWMDAIPGLPIKVGLDGIIGLIPGVGDASTAILALILVFLVTTWFNPPSKVIVKMLLNVLIDFLIGLTPIIGDIFDILYKANLKNLKILEDYYETNQHIFMEDTETV